jgi:hypothetical protein
MANFNSTPSVEALATDIGETIYIDVAKWHLYLAEAHLHTLVAEKVIPLLEARSLSLAAIQQILADIPVALGGGQLTVALGDLVPASSQQALLQLLSDRLED